MYCIALTGTIASGKSTVANEFKKRGIEVISADLIAKELTASNQPAFLKIVGHFGEQVVNDSGELNRAYLRDLIFANSNQRVWLERLLHPLIRQEIERRINTARSPYCLIEIPLLFEKANYPYVSRVLLITSETEQQIARVMARDNSSREQALAIIAAQVDIKKYRALADDILINSGTIAGLQKKITSLHNDYLQRASNA